MTHHKSFAGKHIWIIGASSGMGKELALELSRRGAVLALSARREDQLQEVMGQCSGAGHMIAPLDAGDPKAMQDGFGKVLENLPKLDSVIFLAAIYSPHDGKKKDIDFIHKTLQINIGGAYNVLDVAVPYFEGKKGGQIVICGSVAGYRGLPSGQPYCSTKAALINLCESLRVELKPSSIDVKVISPGFVKTPLTDKNTFPMPMMIEADEAARHIADDLLTNKFEIHFPKRFTYIMKIIKLLPNWIYLPLIAKVRG